jgi:hypothetical protein
MTHSDQPSRWQQFLQRLRSQQWRGYVLIGVILYLVLVNQFIRVRPDHVFIALLLLALSLGRGRVKHFVVDWTPWILSGSVMT